MPNAGLGRAELQETADAAQRNRPPF